MKPMRPNPWPLLRRLARPSSGESDPVSDAELLARFARDRDQAAFELLLWRHGPMVLGACRRILRDAHLAEDALQAAFLILARKAGTVRAGGSVAGWLHRVARRVALRAARQHTRTERLAADSPGRPPPASDDELRSILDAEIDRLPDRFRLPMVLCYLDGRTAEDAARLLGIPRGTVLSRLANARQRLAARLTRRGITAPAALAAVAGSSVEVISTETVAACVSTAVCFASGVAVPGASVQLAEGVLRMGVCKVTAAWAAVVLTAAGLGTGIGVVAADQGEDGSRAVTATAPTEAAANPQEKPANPPPAGSDEPRAKATAERKARLEKAVEELTARIESEAKKLRAEIRPLELDPESASTELARLSAEIARLNAERARTQQIPYALRKALEDARAELKAAESAAVSDAVIQEAISRHPEVKRLTQAVAAKAGELSKASVGAKSDDSKVAMLKQQRDDLANQLRELKDRVRPEVTEYLRCDEIVTAKSKVAEAESAFRSVEEARSVIEYEYREASKRYELLSSNIQAVRSATDELQLLREIRNQLRREILLAEYSPLLTTAPAGSNPRVEQLQAELEVVKRELKRLSGAKNK
jgi:RNA polymerase sigma factor (sigma-70 family)